MKKCLAFLLGCLLCSTPSWAQGISSPMFPGPGTPSGAAPAYSGPANVVASPVGWWGFRAVSTAYAASLGALFDINNGVTTTTIHATSGGGPNSSDLLTSGCASINTCKVVTIYDQSGNGHNCTQGTPASQPVFYPNGLDTGKPAMFVGIGSNFQLSCSGLPTTTVPFSFVATFNPGGVPSGNDRIFVAADPIGLLYGSGAKIEFDAGTLVTSTTSTSVGTWYAAIGRTDGTSTGGVVSVNGSTTTSLNAGSNSTGTPGLIPSTAADGGYYEEWGYWGSNFSSGNTSSMSSNMQGYF